MKTKEEIFDWLTDLLEEMFEVEANDISLDSSLAEIDIDSIDAVDVVVRFKELTGRRIEPEVFKSVRTVRDLVDALYGLISE